MSPSRSDFSALVEETDRSVLLGRAQVHVPKRCPQAGVTRELVLSEAHQNGMLTVVEVASPDHPSQVFSAVSFFYFKDGRISRLTEYWADCIEPPEWRKPYAERY